MADVSVFVSAQGSQTQIYPDASLYDRVSAIEQTLSNSLILPKVELFGFSVNLLQPFGQAPFYSPSSDTTTES